MTTGRTRARRVEMAILEGVVIAITSPLWLLLVVLATAIAWWDDRKVMETNMKERP